MCRDRRGCQKAAHRATAARIGQPVRATKGCVNGAVKKAACAVPPQFAQVCKRVGGAKPAGGCGPVLHRHRQPFGPRRGPKRYAQHMSGQCKTQRTTLKQADCRHPVIGQILAGRRKARVGSGTWIPPQPKGCE